MFDITQLFISSAMAQTEAAPVAEAASSGSIGMSFVPLLLILGVFYVLLIRPQQKKLDEQNRMIKALKRGDRIITGGGVHGKVVRLEGDDSLIVEIADGVQIKVVRNTVAALAAKTEPAPKAEQAPPANSDKKD